MALTGEFDDTYTTKREPRGTYRYAAHYEPSGFSAHVYGPDGDLAGSPTITWPVSLAETGSRESACREWIEGCIEDRVGVR